MHRDDICRFCNRIVIVYSKGGFRQYAGGSFFFTEADFPSIRLSFL